MKDISELKVKQIRIFGADRVPFAALRTAMGKKAMAELFSWNEIVPNPITGELIFGAGAFQPKDAPPIIVDSLQIGDRRIVLEVSGDSEKATAIYTALAEGLVRFDRGRRWADASPIVLVHETSCVATLDFDWRSLLSSPLVQFAKELASKLTNDSASATIAGVNCGIIFSFGVKDPSILQNGITLSNKTFAIEPRVNTPLSERRYYTFSPVDSDKHLVLLREIEALIAGKQSDTPKERKRRITLDE
jgi:hypothetical protein